MKKMLLIVNPAAGKKKAPKVLTKIISIFNRAGYAVSVYITAARNEATEIVAQRADQVDLIVCAGGDGTFNETVSGLLQSGVDIPIGYIPAGSTNDFAASLKLPMKPLKAAQAIAEGKPVSYDIGLFGDRHFAYVASFGAFTKSSYATSQSVKNALGHTAYLLNGVTELAHIHKIPVKLELDGEVIEDEFLFGAICNSTSVGGIIKLDPSQVDMSDGLFEVFLVRSPKKLSDLRKFLRDVSRKKFDSPMVTFRSAKNVTVYADPEMSWTLDGEHAAGHEKIEIINRHHAIRLIQKED